MSVSIGTYDDDELGRMPRRLIKRARAVRVQPERKALPKIAQRMMANRATVKTPPPLRRSAMMQRTTKGVPASAPSAMRVARAPQGPTDAQIEAAVKSTFSVAVAKLPAKEQARIAALFKADAEAAKVDPKVKALMTQVQNSVAAKFRAK